jgi:glycosyltransferase involved in cell wall biosynthesis
MRDEARDESSSLIPHPSSLGRIAVIHDWLTGMRGGEAVLEAILEALPGAELFTLFHFRGSVSDAIESRTIHTSSLQPIAKRVRDYRKLLPLFPRAIRRFDLRDFDVIVSSSHCVAKSVNALGRPHLCYCHTPMRYIWDRFDDYFPKSQPMRRAAAQLVASRLRAWDVRTAAEVTEFLANSNFVKQRIAAYYGRESEVVHPFVDEQFLDAPLGGRREDYHVIVSALVPYKRIDLAMATGKRIVVIGSGPLLRRLRRTAPPNVELLGSVQRDRIVERLSRARSLILPGIEDFGITPLEAMACGTPVVALRAGGVLDTVEDGRTGIFFDRQNVDSLRRALDEVESRQWDRELLRARAAKFSRARFTEQFLAALNRVVGRG